MSITKKSILIILSIMIPLFLVMYFVSEQVSYRGFERIEIKNVQQNLLRAQDAIDTKLHNLQAFVYDWSAWDDTYAFVQNHNQEYVTSNMGDYTFLTTGINMMLIIDNSGQIVYAKAYDLDKNEEVPLPVEMLEQINRGVLTTPIDDFTGVSGIILVSGLPMLLVSDPIITSQGEGPALGTFIMGQYINTVMVKEISETTHLTLNMQTNTGDSPFGDFKLTGQQLDGPESFYIQALDNDHIVGYRALYDIYGSPISILKVEMLRDVYSQAQTTVAYLHTIILLVGIIFISLFIFVLKKTVLNRVIVLEKNVMNIGKTAERSKRIVVTGRDELSSLASNINIMLGSLEKADEEIKVLYNKEKAHVHDLEEEGKARAQFINILAHELRTPLTPILISVEMVRDVLASDPNTLQYRMINNALTSAETLRSRLEELLDLARFARGAFKLNIQSVQPDELIEIIATRYKPVLEQKHQNLILDLASDLPQVQVDPSRFEQVMVNLLSNASKYSPENSDIKLKAKVNDTDLLIEVQDQGIGIPTDEFKNLFKPYHRVNNDKQKYPGTGLGLAVSSQIIEAHEGKIWAESERGKGSSFKFTIPIKSLKQEVETTIKCRTFSEMVATAKIENPDSQVLGGSK
jgi:signal transduction histidine kinase